MKWTGGGSEPAGVFVSGAHTGSYYMDRQLQVAMDCEDAVHKLTSALEERGMRVYRSFDLRAALAAIPDCTCPHHGTDKCTCQYAVLFVYGRTSTPLLIVAHGRDGWTHLLLSEEEVVAAEVSKSVWEVLTALFQQETTLRRVS